MWYLTKTVYCVWSGSNTFWPCFYNLSEAWESFLLPLKKIMSRGRESQLLKKLQACNQLLRQILFCSILFFMKIWKCMPQIYSQEQKTKTTSEQTSKRWRICLCVWLEPRNHMQHFPLLQRPCFLLRQHCINTQQNPHHFQFLSEMTDLSGSRHANTGATAIWQSSLCLEIIHFS